MMAAPTEVCVPRGAAWVAHLGRTSARLGELRLPSLAVDAEP